MDTRIQVQGILPASKFQIWLIRIIQALIILMAVLIGVSALNHSSKIEGIVIYSRPPRGHDNSFVYSAGDLPPVGGVHNSLLQNCGIYDSPIEPERAVHSMEHGAIWITYYPELAGEEIVVLQELVRDQEYFLLSPFPGQRSPVVLTAWGVQLELGSVYDKRVKDFITRYLLGPTTPELGASCTGGFGKPLP